MNTAINNGHRVKDSYRKLKYFFGGGETELMTHRDFVRLHIQETRDEGREAEGE